MQIKYQDDSFCCWGAESQGGIYILRLSVAERLRVRFGRFQQGQPIDVPPGDYLYVGSALGQKGSGSLARRLLRHASRLDVANPQPIRQQMLALFPQIGLGPKPLRPPAGKKLRWHVDFLLEEVAVELRMIYFVRVKKRNTEGHGDGAELRGEKKDSRSMETAVARHLLTLPQITPLVPGLGSTDDPGGTHLLRVTAVPAWWQTFPDQLTHFLQGIIE